MKEFRFVILGAGNIAGKFCEAVSLIEGAAVVAVASKSLTKAMNFAEKNGVVKAYGDYEEMLQMEKPDGAYIAVTPNDHHRLSMLCLKYGVPVLCEKAMFRNSREAREVFSLREKEFLSWRPSGAASFRPCGKQKNGWLQGESARQSLPIAPSVFGQTRIRKNVIIHRSLGAALPRILRFMPMRSRRISSARN